MNFFETIFLNIILIMFPILIYLFYLAYNKNISKKEKNLFFILCIISSFYLVFKNTFNQGVLLCAFLLGIPILFCYLKEKIIFSNVLALLIYILVLKKLEGAYLIIIQYILIDILFFIKEKKKINNLFFTYIYILINILFFIFCDQFYNFDINKITLVFIIISYIFIILISYLLFTSGSNIIKNHLDYKELQKEKQIRLSLFKITHEIKNPIAVIKGYLDMLDIKNEKQVQKYIPIIEGEIKRLLNLLEDFLLVNRNNMDFDVMDIGMLIEDALYKFNNIADNVIINYEELDDEIFINGDYNRLEQVLINILKNSIESISEERVGIINIKPEITDRCINIFISDNGCGMTKKILEKIKEPFYTTKNKGTGLGVSLSYEIIEAHKGKIIYESEEGVGTTVKISLPLYN